MRIIESRYAWVGGTNELAVLGSSNRLNREGETSKEASPSLFLTTSLGRMAFSAVVRSRQYLVERWAGAAWSSIPSSHQSFASGSLLLLGA